jgi:hypothetical protein
MCAKRSQGGPDESFSGCSDRSSQRDEAKDHDKLGFSRHGAFVESALVVPSHLKLLMDIISLGWALRGIKQVVMERATDLLAESRVTLIKLGR